MPQNVAGGVVIVFTPQTRWLACREDGGPDTEPKWWRYYVASKSTSAAAGAAWVHFVADDE